MNFVVGCSSNPGISNSTEDNTIDTSVTPIISTLKVSDSLKHELSDKSITITVSYAAIECGCPQWFETRFKDVEFLEDVERFYLEPTGKELVNANDLWDGEHLPLTLKITGRFSKEKGIPITYHSKGVLEKARIFWYNNITVLTPPPKR